MSSWFLIDSSVVMCMSAIKGQPNKSSGSSSNKSLFMVAGIIGLIAALGLAYMILYVSPDVYSERVQIIAVTDSGCIAETFDGFAVNIGDCQAEEGEYVNALIDKKVKDRAAAMNPT